MIRVRSAICACVAAILMCSATAPAGTKRPPAADEMVSWVVLGPSHPEIEIDGLRRRLDAAFPGEFWPPDDRRSFVVGGPTPTQFLIRSTVNGASGLFLAHIVPVPYTRFSGLVRAIADPALRREALAQCCWLSVDRIGKSGSDREAYRFIGGALAQLAPDNAAILLHPSRGIAMPLDATNRRRLAAGLQPDG